MKVDKRYRMYGIENANYCTSMSWHEYLPLKKHLFEAFGYGTPCHVALDRKVNYNTNWYHETENNVVTLYFPNKEDIDTVIKLQTFSVLDG